MAASSSEEFFGYAYAQISSFDFVRLLHEKLMHHLTALFTTQDDEHVAYSEYHSTNLTSQPRGCDRVMPKVYHEPLLGQPANCHTPTNKEVFGYPYAQTSSFYFLFFS